MRGKQSTRSRGTLGKRGCESRLPYLALCQLKKRVVISCTPNPGMDSKPRLPSRPLLSTLSNYLPPAMDCSKQPLKPLPPNFIPTRKSSSFRSQQPAKTPEYLARIAAKRLAKRGPMAVMRAKPYAKPGPTRVQPWRTVRGIDPAAKIRDFECDIALDSTPEASKTFSRTKDSRTPAHDEQPETQRRDEAERGNPTASRTGGRWMISATTSETTSKYNRTYRTGSTGK